MLNTANEANPITCPNERHEFFFPVRDQKIEIVASRRNKIDFILQPDRTRQIQGSLRNAIQLVPDKLAWIWGS